MKKIIFLFCLVNFSLFAQEETQNTIITSNDSLIKNEIPVTLNNTESIPIAPGCENISKSEQIKCFIQFLNQHIIRNFQYPDKAYNKKIQGKVQIEIVINKEGIVDKINTRGPHKILEEECRRIVSLLPKFTPGFQNGKPVNVKYTFPIVFRIQ